MSDQGYKRRTNGPSATTSMFQHGGIRMSKPSTNDIERAYEAVWERCPEQLNLRAPWRSRTVDDCRATIRKGPEALAALQAAFSEETLEAARIIRRDEKGLVSLRGALWDDAGAIIALRRAADQPPFDL